MQEIKKGQEIEPGRNDLLVLDRVVISLKSKELLSVDTCVKPGEVLTLMGPSGSGKSTLLAYMAGFLDPVFKAQGGIRFGDNDLLALPPHQRRVGLLFQDALLFPHMSVGGNLAFALPPSVKGRQLRLERVEAALADADLQGLADRDPATLSGGQKARVALMRVLLSDPQVLLLDEPFSKLDADLRGQIRQFVFDQAIARNLPVILVTHDQADADAVGGRIITLGNGRGGTV